MWVGTPMMFIRLAGCNVGRPAHAVKVQGPFPVLQSGVEAVACTSWDGRTFPCDTDYRRSSTEAISSLVNQCVQRKYKHACITGGEPFIHADKLDDLVHKLTVNEIMVHIETSGTIYPMKHFSKLIFPQAWITCAPKIGALDKMIERADELKLLVDEDFDLYKLTVQMMGHRNVFLCPINGVDTITEKNVKRCTELLETFPNWRMSVQMHKFFNWR